MTERRHIPDRVKRDVLARDGWLCCLCGSVIGCRYEIEHRVALGLGGSNDPDNLGATHKLCHRLHKTPLDRKMMARADRARKRHQGLKPAGKLGKGRFKRKLSGEVVLR